ncbi:MULTISPECIES: hypothetical protein [unclassified Stygiolobus]|uniref:hypothetical protein n=1 Tax=unclassified Stygiolobus TaxID=2824672 RepID=UPI00307EB385
MRFSIFAVLPLTKVRSKLTNQTTVATSAMTAPIDATNSAGINVCDRGNITIFTKNNL